MYTESYRAELDFWRELIHNGQSAMADGRPHVGRVCPRCHTGRVISECHVGVERGSKTYQFHHSCNQCGEVFDYATMRCDIFFNRPYEISDILETPFGEVEVFVNGEKRSFHHRIEELECWEENNDKTITVHYLDIDLSELHLGDLVFCGFKSGNLAYYDADERTTMSTVEKENLVLGFCIYYPDDWLVSSRDHCYELYEFTPNGYTYEVTDDPSNYDVHYNFESCIATVSIAWADKSDFLDTEEELSCVLL